jgi:hypothetical protein
LKIAPERKSALYLATLLDLTFEWARVVEMSKILGLTVLMALLAQLAWAEPLRLWVTIDDGLNPEATDPRSDDYVRLSLIIPSYQSMATLSERVDSWLGPGMVQIRSDSLVLIQAPRDSHARVKFIAALLALEMPPLIDPPA